MTDRERDQLDAKVAALTAIMERVEKSVARAEELRDEHAKELRNMMERVVTIEQLQQREAGIIEKVEHNTSRSNARDAVNADRERRFDNRLAAVGTGLGSLSLVLHIIDKWPFGG